MDNEFKNKVIVVTDSKEDLSEYPTPYRIVRQILSGVGQII